MKRIIKKISTLLMSAVLFLAVCTGCTSIYWRLANQIVNACSN